MSGSGFGGELGLSALGGECYDGERLLAALPAALEGWRFGRDKRCATLLACRELAGVLDGLEGECLQRRWERFEERIWPRWVEGIGRPPPHRWSLAPRLVVMSRAVRPGWPVLGAIAPIKWLAPLPESDPLKQAAAELRGVLSGVSWSGERMHDGAMVLALRIMLARGYGSLSEIVEADLCDVTLRQRPRGIDTLDAALCALGVLERTPKRGPTRLLRGHRQAPRELAQREDLPERFRAVTELYLEAYERRVSDNHPTLRNKANQLARFWRFIGERYPEIESSRQILPAHARAFIPAAIEQARADRRGSDGDQAGTVHGWLTTVRTFFTDLCAWATEPDSPLAEHAPRTLPLTHRDLTGVGFENARRRREARMTATILELEREVPRIRAYALRAWQETDEAFNAAPDDPDTELAERDAFWDWALLELLVHSGLRVEEACQLTTLDVLRRHQPDGSVYYLLHVKPSKFDRARVIPVGDGLGRVIAEIIRHVRRFYGSRDVPACDNWDRHERRALARAPYLLQGAQHPSAIAPEHVRARLARLSRAAGARRIDGTALVLRPHDCRRIFASEHLNNDTPPHVIQALLGHAAIDTVMVYAKLYPRKLVEEYRKATRGTYQAFHGQQSERNPTTEEWAAFARSCSLRDMGTHVCALPTGEHCPRGLVCLGCTHAQPKKSAAPTFRRMVHSHQRALAGASKRGEPAGQIAARELEITRIEGALRRAEELNEDVAAAIEAATA